MHALYISLCWCYTWQLTLLQTEKTTFRVSNVTSHIHGMQMHSYSLFGERRYTQHGSKISGILDRNSAFIVCLDTSFLVCTEFRSRTLCEKFAPNYTLRVQMMAGKESARDAWQAACMRIFPVCVCIYIRTRYVIYVYLFACAFSRVCAWTTRPFSGSFTRASLIRVAHTVGFMSSWSGLKSPSKSPCLQRHCLGEENTWLGLCQYQNTVIIV